MNKEEGILFTTEMVHAILDDRKSVTRRIANPQPVIDENSGRVFIEGRQPYDIHDWTFRYMLDYPRWKVGKVYYVRETWRMVDCDFHFSEAKIEFKTGQQFTFQAPDEKASLWIANQSKKNIANDKVVFCPGIHLPKWCSRIWIECTAVSIEQVQSISKIDAINEGVYREVSTVGVGAYVVNSTFYKNYLGDGLNVRNWTRSPVASFRSLWEKIHGRETWDKNVWVHPVHFKVLSTIGKP